MSVLFGLATLPWSICKIVGDNVHNKEEKRFAETFWFIPWIFVFSMVVAAFIPSSTTVYMIATSEAGEMVVNTPEAKEIMSDLKEILNIQLDKLKE
jgi:hypothetical protein